MSEPTRASLWFWINKWKNDKIEGWKKEYEERLIMKILRTYYVCFFNERDIYRKIRLSLMKKELQKRLKNFDVDIDLLLFAAVNKRVDVLNVFAIGQEDFFDVLRWKDNEMEKFLFENPEIKQKLLRKKREKERRRRRIKQMKIEIEKQKHIENCKKLRPIRH